ncbi:MAG TPA: uroporphyrinogen decarboxylase [Thermoanaerobaculia bacterium]|nr:uroporphyrinogen decarboxylase [Thermoanaerobaculia bacterium]
MNDLFLRACRGEATERRPVWMMRQAGRYLPEYRAIRQKVDFLTLCKTPELAAEVTVQPVDIVGVDAAIIFADILLPLEAMGAELVFAAGDGPVFPRPVRDRAGIAALRALGDEGDAGVEETLGYVFEALRTTRRALAGPSGDQRVPLIGFAGTPWTLAAYLVEGGTSKSFGHLLGWSWADPQGLAELLDRLAGTTIAYLRGQVRAGAQALQLFDTWGGLLDLGRWRRIALPPVLQILRALRESCPGVPLIYYLNGGGHLLPGLAELPVDVLSVDWRQPLSEVRSRLAEYGARPVLQGNFDPTALLAPVPEIERQVDVLLAEGTDAARPGRGHVVNLGHGILPQTPVEHALAFVRAAQERSRSEKSIG